MNLKLINAQLPKERRILVTSDIHGNLPVLKKVLALANYSPEDTFIVCGDLIEKGPANLDTLHLFMELSMLPNVFLISGNAEPFCYDLYLDNLDANAEFLDFLLRVPNTTVFEMCSILDMPINLDSNVSKIKSAVLQNFPKEINFLENLPHILNTENFIFAHAGLQDLKQVPLDQQNPYLVLKNDAFLSQNIVFPKFVFLGHWPTVNYCNSIGSCNPIVQPYNKIVSIDGGNVVKEDGQINIVEIPSPDYTKFNMGINSWYADDLTTVKVTNSQQSSQNSICINWCDNLVEVIKPSQYQDFQLCKHVSSGKLLDIPSDFLYSVDGKMKTRDCTDYFLQLVTGESISLIRKFNKYSYCKKNGVLGWADNNNINV